MRISILSVLLVACRSETVKVQTPEEDIIYDLDGDGFPSEGGWYDS